MAQSSNLNRREFLRQSAGAAAALAASRARVKGAPSGPRPNILVFLTDDHGQWAQHGYGNRELRTPHLDRLAASGVRMTSAFTTSPVCSPARASFFTGRMPSQHGIHDWIQPKYDFVHPGLSQQPLLSQLLRDAGYHTGLVGKWHCGRNREPQPGFDRWFTHYDNQYPHRGLQRFSDQGKLRIEHGQQSPLLTDEAIAFLRRRRKERAGEPFFLFVSYVDTHTPHEQAPDDLVAACRAANFRDLPIEGFAACHGTTIWPVYPDPAKERDRKTECYAAVESIDREAGRILTELEAAGEIENTLIVYTSDHGVNGGHHGFWEKGNATWPQNFVDESIRVPCTVSWTAGGIATGAVCDDFVNHCDLWATLLEAAAAAAPDQAGQIRSPGRSYLGRLRRPGESGGREAIVCEYGNARMVRTRGHKLIRRRPYRGVGAPDELYDLAADPRETRNVLGEPGREDIARGLGARLDRFFAEYSTREHDGFGAGLESRCTDQSPWYFTEKTYG